MGVTVPSEHPWPDPGTYATGQDIEDPDVADLGQTSNYLDCHGGTEPVIEQGWTESAFTTSSNGVFTRICQYMVPEIGKQHAQVLCGVYAVKNTAGTATIRFESTGSGDTLDVTVTTTVGWKPDPWAGLLDLTFTAGADEVVVYVKTSDANTVTVHDIQVEYPDLTALTVPPPSGETIAPVDDDELDGDSPLASGAGRMLRTNLATLEARPKVYWQWSALAGITTTGVDMSVMNPRYMRVWVPVHIGSGDSDDFALTVWVYGGNVATDAQFAIQHGSGSLRFGDGAERGGNFTTVTLPADAANPQWYSTTIQFPDGNDLPRAPVPWSHIDVDGIAIAATGAEVYAISIWGR